MRGDILLYQKTGSIVTNNPLMFFDQNLNSKSGVILGEGIWRWKLHDYLKNNNNDSFDEMILKTIQYLSVKADKKCPMGVITDIKQALRKAAALKINYSANPMAQ